jgi:hypothetical protein
VGSNGHVGFKQFVVDLSCFFFNGVVYKILKLDPAHLFFLFVISFDANIMEDKIIIFCL